MTDADVELGRIDPERFAGGTLELEPERARRALADAIGAPLGMAPTLAAYGIAEMVDEAMANAARVHAIERGKNVAERALIAFGGAAPLHAGRLAEKLGIAQVVVPTGAGVGSAVGFLRAPAAYEVVRSRYMRLSTFDPEPINEVFDQLEREASAVVEAAAPAAALLQQRLAHMRYVGQGHEVVAPLPARLLATQDRRILQAAFDEAYIALYGRLIPALDVEVLSWGLKLSSEVEPVMEIEGVPASPVPAPAARRAVFDAATAGTVEIPLYWRPDLAPGAFLDGPALLAEPDTTILVPQGFTARIDGRGYVILSRGHAEASR